MFGFTNILRKTATLAFVGGRAATKQCGQLGRNDLRHYGTTKSALQASKFLLRYDYIPEVLEKRGPYREEHIALAKQCIEEGTCLSGGPTGEVGMEVPTGALFIFTNADSAMNYAETDPYVANGIVTRYSIEEWNVVVQTE